MSKKVLYVSDLDGTLLNSQAMISQNSLSIINSLINKGMHFTYATARSLVSSSKVTVGLKKDIPVIVYNGAFIMNAKTQEILYSCSFSLKVRQDIQKILNAYNIHPLVYSFVDGKEKVLWHLACENEGMKRYLSQRINDQRMTPLSLQDDLYQGNIFYYTCIGNKEDLEPIYCILKESHCLTCTFQQEIYRDEYWLEIMPRQATKANAIKQLKKIWNCEKIICFGDAINDKPMFEISDEGYAVANAIDDLKESATAIILDNDSDGVAVWLKENV